MYEQMLYVRIMARWPTTKSSGYITNYVEILGMHVSLNV